MRKNPQDPDGVKMAYAQAQIRDKENLTSLSGQVSARTTVSRADAKACIEGLVEVMVEELRKGNQVELDGIGRFRLSLTSDPAESADKFTAANIVGVRVIFSPGEELRNLFHGMEFNPVPTRAAAAKVLKAQKAGETTVDISSVPSEEDADLLSADSGNGSNAFGNGSAAPVSGFAAGKAAASGKSASVKASAAGKAAGKGSDLSDEGAEE